MIISKILIQAKKILKDVDIKSHALDADLLLQFILGFSREQVVFQPDFEISKELEIKYFELINRRKNREPISHIVGKREFYGREFLVNKNVLDPRPDSETLIETVLSEFKDQNQKLNILEIGVGSGCLVVTLLNLYKNAVAMGIDVSDEALEICKKNAQINNVSNRLELANHDILKGKSYVSASQKLNLRLSDTESAFANDLIISNPPYIPADDIQDLQPEVKNFEPHLALVGGEDGLDFYRAIAKNIPNKNVKIILEIGINQEEKIIDIFAQNDITYLGEAKDLAGITRVLIFQC